MTILLIGGTGVLSSAVAAEALKQGMEVTMINRGSRPDLIPSGVKWVKADKADYDFIRESVSDTLFDAVIDFLCYTEKEVDESYHFYSPFTKQYFFISSCAVFNACVTDVLNEDAPKVLPGWAYSRYKWEAEQRLIASAAQAGAKYTIVRPGITYGDTRIPYGVCPRYGYHWTWIARILNDKPIIRWNKGENRWNMMRVEDFAVGLVGLIGNERAYNEAFNLCGDDTPSFNEVLAVVSELIDHPITIVDVSSKFYASEMPSKKGEIYGYSVNYICSNEKIKRCVPAFKQTLSLKEGLTKTLAAYKIRNYQRGIDWEFDAETDRVVSKWCKKEHQDTHFYRLGFVDYLGNATIKDKLTYRLYYHRNNVFIKLFLQGVRVLRKAVRMVKL